MGDDADQAVAFGQHPEHIHRLIEVILTQGSEAFVDKERLHLPAPGVVLHHVRQSERQRERGKEGLAAGEGAGTAPPAGAVVQHLHLKTGCGVAPIRGRLVYKLVAASAHQFHAAVGHFEHLTEYGAHNIAVKAQLAAVAAAADSQRGEPVQTLPRAVGL